MIAGLFGRLRARRTVPPRIIIHTGLHKTGSSTLQDYLYASRTAMRDHGFVYPDLEAPNHYKLAVAVAGDDEAGRASLIGYMGQRAAAMAGQGPAILAGIADQVARLGESWLILSHENFAQPIRLDQLLQFLRSIAPEAHLYGICYARSAPKLYASVLQQVIKVRRIAQPPGVWVSNHEDRAMLILDRFADRAIVRAYDRSVLTGADIVEDFRGVVRKISGRDLPSAMPMSSNAALSGAVTALLYRHALAFPDVAPEPFFELRDQLRRFCRRRSDPPLQLPADWAALLERRHHETWNALVERMDHDTATRARLMLSGAPAGKVRAGRPALLAWVDSHHHGAFAAAFAEWAGSEGALAPDTLAWVRQQVQA